jgi:hypothetical protein
MSTSAACDSHFALRLCGGLTREIARATSRRAAFNGGHIGRGHSDDGGDQLDIVDETSELTKRQAELESAMKQPGGARVIEERELRDVKRKLGTLTLPGRAARSGEAPKNK